MQIIRISLTIFIVSVFMTACSSVYQNPDNTAPIVVKSAGPDDESVTVGALGAGDGQGDTSIASNTQAGVWSVRVVNFDYDSSALNAESEAIIVAHVEYLRANAAVNIVLEGHADERGTREYNLALGEDRALSVANLMQVLGIGADRIQMVSYGEEQPMSLGSDEDAWSANRRVEILY